MFFWRFLGLIGLIAVALSARMTFAATVSVEVSEPQHSGLLQICAIQDQQLHQVANELAELLAHPEAGRKRWTNLQLSEHLKRLGYAYPGAQWWSLQASKLDRRYAAERAVSWLSSVQQPEQSASATRRRCGIATVNDSRSGETMVVVTLLQRAYYTQKIPKKRQRTGWVTVQGGLLEPCAGVNVLVQGPNGEPRTIPTSFDGRNQSFLARFMADRPGEWHVQVLADLAQGPEAVLQAYLHVGRPTGQSTESIYARYATKSDKSKETYGKTSSSALLSSAPMQTTKDFTLDTQFHIGVNNEQRLLALLNGLRKAHGVAQVRRQPELDRLARNHTIAMISQQLLAHNTGQGNPSERATKAGISALQVGENIAKAATASLAHKAMYNSLSHRQNMLHSRYHYVGISALRDAAGVLWVTMLFRSHQ